ncbi:MAG: hypothetical protein ACTHKP_14100 [Nitrososphaeraceae archaeon]
MLEKTNISQKVAVVSLFIVSLFAAAGLTTVIFLSDSIVVAQSLGNDPLSSCVKTVGDAFVGKTIGDNQNWTKSTQNFVSLLTTDNTVKLLNENVAHDGFPGDTAKPITDMSGIWDMLNNGNMTQWDRFHLFPTQVIHNLAAARPGFTQLQQIMLSRCISDKVNTLGPTPVY